MGWIETVLATVAGGTVLGLGGLAIHDPRLMRRVANWALAAIALVGWTLGSFGLGILAAATGEPADKPLTIAGWCVVACCAIIGLIALSDAVERWKAEDKRPPQP